jgi:hypothetical protein
MFEVGVDKPIDVGPILIKSYFYLFLNFQYVIVTVNKVLWFFTNDTLML